MHYYSELTTIVLHHSVVLCHWFDDRYESIYLCREGLCIILNKSIDIGSTDCNIIESAMDYIYVRLHCYRIDKLIFEYRLQHSAVTKVPANDPISRYLDHGQVIKYRNLSK